MWIGPSLTPSSTYLLRLHTEFNRSRSMIAGNPAFRVYDVDPDTYEIMDARVFIGPASIVTMQKILTVLILGDLADPTFQTSRERSSSV